MLIRLIVVFAVIYLGFKLSKSLGHIGFRSSKTPDGENLGKIDDVMLQDPHCNVYFVKSSGVELKEKGERLFFCSTRCRDDYLKSHTKKSNFSKKNSR